MPHLPARASRGPPDMTRRLPDRAHVRRRGLTRCCRGRLSQSPRHAPTPVAPPCGLVGSTTQPAASLSQREDIPEHTHVAWCSAARSAPALTLGLSRASQETGSTGSTVPDTISSCENAKSRLCETLSSPHHRKQLEEHSAPLPDQSQTCVSTLLRSGEHLETDCKVFDHKRWQKSRTCTQVQDPPHDKGGRALATHHRRWSIPSSLLLLLFLLLLPCVLLASPASSRFPAGKMRSREIEQPSHFILRTPLCRPVSREDLRRMMGASFDSSRMASDVATAKRNFLSEYSDAFDPAAPPGFQGDDPRVSRVSSSDDLVQDEILWTSDWERGGDDDDDDDEEEGEYMDDEPSWARSGEMEEAVEEDIEEEEEIIERPYSSWRSRKDEPEGDAGGEAQQVKHRRREQGWEMEDSREYSPTRQRVITGSYAYMKRRRRKRSPQSWRSRDRDAVPSPDSYVNSKRNASSGSSGGHTSSTNRQSDRRLSGARRSGRVAGAKYGREGKGVKNVDDEANDAYDDKKAAVDKKSDLGVLPLRLALSGKNKELRKSLKKQFRLKAKNLRKRPPPWECKMSSKTLIMNEGVFPKVLVDGHCETKKCFYRLYDCESQRYNIKLMQRDPSHCVPVPTVGNATVFEERWNLVSRQITVGCNCVNAANKRWKSRNGGGGRRRTGRKKSLSKRSRPDR